MSAVMTPAEIVAALEKWEVPYRLEHGWKTRGRPGPFGNMHGTVNHHTVTPNTAKPAAVDRLLRVGRSDLPGPLSQFSTRRNGVVSVIAAGRSNHAGAVRRSVLKAFLADRRVKRPRLTGGETVDGNAFLYGNEVHHDGSGRYTSGKQLRSLVLLNAAIADHHGWSANAAAQHYTITRRKVDMAQIRNAKRNPDDLDMDRWLRREVGRALKAGPGQYALPGDTAPEPTPAPEDTVTSKDIAAVADAVIAELTDALANPESRLAKVLRNNARLAAQAEHVDERAGRNPGQV